MNDDMIAVTGGVDCHQRTHHTAALDATGRLLADAEFPANLAGYQALLAWLQTFGTIVAVGVESTGAYGAGLTRFLRSAGVTVIEVNQPHPHTRSRRGKTDAIDAEAAARKVLSGEARVIPKDTTGAVEAIRQLQIARHSAVKARSAALCQLGELLTTAPASVRETVTGQRKTLEGQATVCARLRPDLARLDDPAHAARFALRGVARRIVALRREIAAYDTQLDALVAAVAPLTRALLGVGTHHTAQLLVTAGQTIDRLHGDGAFAHLCGADPIPASSGKTIRHRLNPGGDRAANRALHMIAVVRLRCCDRTRAYADRRRAEGKTTKRSCAASSATSPDRSTAPSSTTSARNLLDIYRNVPVRFTAGHPRRHRRDPAHADAERISQHRPRRATVRPRDRRARASRGRHRPTRAARGRRLFWSRKVIGACHDHDVRYHITVRRTKAVVAAIEQIDEAAWVDIAYPDGGQAQVAETTLGDHQRLIVRRTRLVGAQAQLFPDWRHHAFVTDRPGTAIDLDADHRRHAVIELAIRDLKHGAGLAHCPSGMFTANAAWAVLATLAHNLWRWTAILGGLATGPVVTKTLRWRYLTIPGRITRSARRLTLHLPTWWPWRDAFIEALSRLRRVTIPQPC